MKQTSVGQQTVGNLLTTASVRFGSQEALYCLPSGRRLTFSQLNIRANRLANALIDQGFHKGDCVAFLTTNRAEIAEIYFALAKAGLVGMPLNYRLAPTEIMTLMRDVNASALLYERSYGDVAREVAAQLPKVRLEIGFGEGEGPGQDYESLLSVASSAEPDVEVFTDDPYYYNLTSGTTGVPKCYLLSHYNNATLANMAISHDLSTRDVVMTVFPAYGRVGFAWLGMAVMYGIRNVLTNFEPASVLDAIGKERVTITNLVATMAAMLLAAPELAKADLSSLRALVFAGSLLPAAIREGVTQHLCSDIYEYYGMQESGAVVVATPEDKRRHPDTVGRVILFAEVRVVDEQGHDVATGESGEILGRSPGSVTAYYNNPEKSAETFRDGWVHTGDLGRLDEEGYLYISGRIKDLIVTGGQNVHAGEVEDALLTQPGVADAAVIGLPDDFWGEAVTAVVVARPGASIDEAALIASCRESLAGFKVPKKVFVQAEPLPRTPTGKIQKFRLVEQYQDWQ